MVRLLVYFTITDKNRASFEELYRDSYTPLLQRQKGFVYTSLGRLYSPQVLREIGAEVPPENYCLTIEFESEAARRAWVATPEHDPAWSRVTSLAESVSYTGYDIVAEAGNGGWDHHAGGYGK